MSSEINQLKLQNHGLKLVNDATSIQLTSLRSQVAALTKERDAACVVQAKMYALEQGVKVAVEALEMWKSHWQSEEQDAEAEGESFSQAWHSTETALAHLTPLLTTPTKGETT